MPSLHAQHREHRPQGSRALALCLARALSSNPHRQPIRGACSHPHRGDVGLRHEAVWRPAQSSGVGPWLPGRRRRLQNLAPSPTLWSRGGAGGVLSLRGMCRGSCSPLTHQFPSCVGPTAIESCKGDLKYLLLLYYVMADSIFLGSKITADGD